MITNKAMACFQLIITAICATVFGGSAAAMTTNATLNGLSIDIDSDSGSILAMSYPGVGTMLQASPGENSIIDLAYPVEKFEALRLASRYSSGASIAKTNKTVTVKITRLGASRKVLERPGDVSAVITFTADPDGRSVIATCEIENNSDTSVKQVIFPDLFGMIPFAGESGTEFRTAGFVSTPFTDLQNDEGRRSVQFCMDYAACSENYAIGGMINPMWLRWFNIGGYKGGLSMFPKRWGWDPQYTVRIHHSESEQKLRLLCVHSVDIKPGEKWNSGEFVITPHMNAWAKGIEPYANFVKEHWKRKYPVPKHVREGIGFRNIQMSRDWPDDPQDAIWKISDIPAIAQEAKDHGLDELVLWSWQEGFRLPLPEPISSLGTEQDLLNANAACKKIGVNLVPFISVVQARQSTAAKYGLSVPESGGWAYHYDAIPRFQPPYMTNGVSVGVDVNNEVWKKEVIESTRRLVDIGLPSLSWDQVWNPSSTQNMYGLIEQIVDYAKKKDPESTFSGEELFNMELDSQWLDYTWNWGGYRDCRAFTSVFPAPRINCCVSSSDSKAKHAFADNMYLAVFPRKPNLPNGSDWIKNWPELSAGLKQCAKLKKQFSRYFTDGRFIGDCILTERCPNVHVSAYILGDRVLVLLLNDSQDQSYSWHYDLAPWINKRLHSCEVKSYDTNGNFIATENIPIDTKSLTVSKSKNNDFAIYEFICK